MSGCEQRIADLVAEVERLRAIEARAQDLAARRGDEVRLSDQHTARWILGDMDYGT